MFPAAAATAILSILHNGSTVVMKVDGALVTLVGEVDKGELVAGHTRLESFAMSSFSVSNWCLTEWLSNVSDKKLR